MSSISVEIPDHLVPFVEQATRDRGYANKGEFIIKLIADASRRQPAIEHQLMEGLSSGPATEWTDDEWQAIRNRVIRSS